MKKLKQLGLLFVTMLKIGLFTFGGGYAMIALLQNEFVEKKNWLPKDEFMDMVAIAESTPGPIAVNSATYIGYKMAGVWGSIMATIGVCLPSFVIIFVISLFLEKFLSLKYVAYAFKGIQVCVSYLILAAGIKMLKGLKLNLFNIIIIVAVFGCMVAFSLFAIQFSSIYYILISGGLGLAVYLVSYFIKRSKQPILTDNTQQTDNASAEQQTKETTSITTQPDTYLDCETQTKPTKVKKEKLQSNKTNTTPKQKGDKK